MINRNDIKMYQDVFYYDELTGQFIRGEVIRILPGHVKVSCRAVTEPVTGMGLTHCAGWQWLLYKDVFATVQEAARAMAGEK